MQDDIFVPRCAILSWSRQMRSHLILYSCKATELRRPFLASHSIGGGAVKDCIVSTTCCAPQGRGVDLALNHFRLDG